MHFSTLLRGGSCCSATRRVVGLVAFILEKPLKSISPLCCLEAPVGATLFLRKPLSSNFPPDFLEAPVAAPLGAWSFVLGTPLSSISPVWSMKAFQQRHSARVRPRGLYFRKTAGAAFFTFRHEGATMAYSSRNWVKSSICDLSKVTARRREVCKSRIFKGDFVWRPLLIAMGL